MRNTTIHEKDIGRLFYGATRDPLCLETSSSDQCAIDIKTITWLHISRSNAETFSYNITIKTVNGATYFGTIR